VNAICQRCKEARATVLITDCYPEKRELHLCESCAAAEGILVKQTETTAAVLQELMKQKAGLSKFDDMVCPQCGMTFREFQLKGLLGCPHDYEVFREVLTPLIERAHDKASHHVGKVPAAADSTLHKRTGIMRLQRELQSAIEQENYELAARVRDQIRSLENP